MKSPVVCLGAERELSDARDADGRWLQALPTQQLSEGRRRRPIAEMPMRHSSGTGPHGQRVRDRVAGSRRKNWSSGRQQECRGGGGRIDRGIGFSLLHPFAVHSLFISQYIY